MLENLSRAKKKNTVTVVHNYLWEFSCCMNSESNEILWYLKTKKKEENYKKNLPFGI